MCIFTYCIYACFSRSNIKNIEQAGLPVLDTADNKICCICLISYHSIIDWPLQTSSFFQYQVWLDQT